MVILCALLISPAESRPEVSCMFRRGLLKLTLRPRLRRLATLIKGSRRSVPVLRAQESESPLEAMRV